MVRVTDDERHEVAKSLQAYGKRFKDPTWRELCNVVFRDGDQYPKEVRKLHLIDRLADLIEPADAQSRDGAKTVDRDSLLSLANEMGEMPQCDICPVTTSCTEYADGCAGAMLRHYACRIREACGEIDE